MADEAENEKYFLERILYTDCVYAVKYLVTMRSSRECVYVAPLFLLVVVHVLRNAFNSDFTVKLCSG